MKKLNGTLTLSASQTASILDPHYKGPWLLPRDVEFELMGGLPTAKGLLAIAEDDHFAEMNHGRYPDVMLAEFAKQLALLTAIEILEVPGFAYINVLMVKSKDEIRAGNTITVTVCLEKMDAFYHFGIMVHDQSNRLIMEGALQAIKLK